TARERFGVREEALGICYTRTGRRFFDDEVLEAAFLDRLHAAAEAAGLFDELNTSWLCLDCELMPTSAKAQALLRERYARAGAAGRHALAAAVDELELAVAGLGSDIASADAPDLGAQTEPLLERQQSRLAAAEKFTDA